MDRSSKKIPQQSEDKDWEISVYLTSLEDYPPVIKRSRLRPDIVLHSAVTKEMILVELTVPYESRMEEAHIFKTEKYSDLKKDLTRQGYKTKIFAVEVGARGFAGTSVYELLRYLNVSSKTRNKAMKALSETAEKSSHWIWVRRNDRKLQKE